MTPELATGVCAFGTDRNPSMFSDRALVTQQPASVYLHGVTMMRTDDPELRDAVHLTNAAYELLGQRFAGA